MLGSQQKPKNHRSHYKQRTKPGNRTARRQTGNQPSVGSSITSAGTVTLQCADNPAATQLLSGVANSQAHTDPGPKTGTKSGCSH